MRWIRLTLNGTGKVVCVNMARATEMRPFTKGVGTTIWLSDKETCYVEVTETVEFILSLC
jgi:hypothetical protein